MQCAYPLSGFKDVSGNVRVLKRDTGVSPHRTASTRFSVPCGRCIACRNNKANEWATRVVHETKYHRRNSFVTLTYDDEHLPRTWSLDKDAPTQFIKNLRNDLRKYQANVRYFGCGEYGEQRGRPHYHVCLFGWDFPDKEKWTEGDHPLYISEQLTRLWPYGYSTIGNVTFQSAAYTAKYALKRLDGEIVNTPGLDGLKPYEILIDDEIYERKREFAFMSRRPGIGRQWVDDYYTDAFPSDDIHISGKRVPIPRYYRKQLERIDPQLYETVSEARRTRAARDFEKRSRAQSIDKVCDQDIADRKRVAKVQTAIASRKERTLG